MDYVKLDLSCLISNNELYNTNKETLSHRSYITIQPLSLLRKDPKDLLIRGRQLQFLKHGKNREEKEEEDGLVEPVTEALVVFWYVVLLLVLVELV